MRFRVKTGPDSVDQIRECVVGQLISHDHETEEEELALLGIGQLVEMMNAMQDRPVGSSGCSLHLD